MQRKIIAAALFALFTTGAQAQFQNPSTMLAVPVASCGAQSLTAGTPNVLYQDATGKLCVNATVSATATFSLTASSTLPTLSAGTGAAGYESLSGGQYVQPIFGTTPVDATHGLPVNVIAGGSAGTTSNASSGVATSSTNSAAVSWLYGFNGTTWDQLQVDGNKYLKVNVAAGGAGGGAVYGPTAVGSANANPPVVIGGTATGAAGQNVEGVAVKPASTASVATDLSLVTNESPNSQLSAATGTTGDTAWSGSGTSTIVAALKAIYNSSISAIAAGTNYIGQIGAWVAPTSYVFGTTAAMTGTTSTQLLAAVTSKKLYVLSISCVNSHATVGTFVTVQDGSGGTTLATLAAASVFGGDEKASVGPLFSTTSGNGLYVADATTGANVICNASGFAQ